jgi:hypothetical protein
VGRPLEAALVADAVIEFRNVRADDDEAKHADEMNEDVFSVRVLEPRLLFVVQRHGLDAKLGDAVERQFMRR